MKNKNIAAVAVESMSDDVLDSLQQDLRTKKHKINISFNDPGVDCGTEVNISAHLVGSHYNMFKVRMN